MTDIRQRLRRYIRAARSISAVRLLTYLIRLTLQSLGQTSLPKSINGRAVRLPLEHYPLSRLLLYNEKIDNYEGPYFKAVLESLHAKDIVFDIGAYHGFYTICMAQVIGPQGIVVAFEPNPRNHEIMLDTVAVNGSTNVVAVKKAAGTGRERRQFLLSHSDSSLREPDSDDEETVEVDVVTIDDYVTRTGMKPHVIKIDVEGYELEVLAGASETLAQCRVICCEVHPRLMEGAGYRPDQLKELLEANNFFNIFSYYPSKHRRDAGKPFNVIYVNRSLHV